MSYSESGVVEKEQPFVPLKRPLSPQAEAWLQKWVSADKMPGMAEFIEESAMLRGQQEGFTAATE